MNVGKVFFTGNSFCNLFLSFSHIHTYIYTHVFCVALANYTVIFPNLLLVPILIVVGLQFKRQY